MGASASSMFKRAFGGLFGKAQMGILMVGLDASGKTTILHKLRLGNVDTTIPTIGFNVETVQYSDRGSIVSFTAWDVGGRDKVRPLWRHYYERTNCVVFVVDSRDHDRIEEAGDQLHSMLAEDELQDASCLIFANKQDLPDVMSVREITNKMGLHKLRNRAWYIQASCAINGDGLYEGLDWLSETITKKHGSKGAAPANLSGVEATSNEGLPDVKDMGMGSDGSVAETACTADTEGLEEEEMEREAAARSLAHVAL